MSYLHDVGPVFLISLGICGLLVVFCGSYTPWLRERGDLGATQALHHEVTPRLGGVGIVLAIALAASSMAVLANDTEQWLLATFAISFLPVFLTGLTEDLGYCISPRGRLIAAACSSLVMIASLRIWLPPTGVAGLDMLLGFAPIGILATVIGTTGISHSFNLIDGVNGLAGGVAIMIGCGLWWIAEANDATTLATLSLAVIAAMAGFLVFNWPSGRIFMGDAGAYSIGHILAWLTILLVWQVKDLSLLAVALMFFWPVADTFLAIWRRWYKGQRIYAPDRLHFHQLVYRVLSQMAGERLSNKALNSVTGLVILPFAGAPVVVAVLTATSGYLAIAAWMGFSLLFVASYLGGIFLFRTRKWPTRPFARDISLQAED